MYKFLGNLSCSKSWVPPKYKPIKGMGLVEGRQEIVEERQPNNLDSLNTVLQVCLLGSAPAGNINCLSMSFQWSKKEK